MRMEQQPRWVRVIDKLIYVAIFGAVLMTIPQVLKIWVGKNASGVSVISWAAYFVNAFIWTLYGISRKDWPIIISSAGWLLLDALIVAGILMYG